MSKAYYYLNEAHHIERAAYEAGVEDERKKFADWLIEVGGLPTGQRITKTTMAILRLRGGKSIRQLVREANTREKD